ncbi:hypothetical protein Tco_0712151 [Tanacetum coccineum]
MVDYSGIAEALVNTTCLLKNSNLKEIINEQNIRNGPVSITTDTSGQIKVLPPRTAEEIRWGWPTNLYLVGNDESKKMQKYILKQQFEGFSISNTEGLHKGYDSVNKKTGRKLQFDAKEPVGFDKTKVECYNCHKTGILLESVDSRELKITGGEMHGILETRGSITGQKEDSKALVTNEGEVQNTRELVSELLSMNLMKKCQPNVWSDAPILEAYRSFLPTLVWAEAVVLLVMFLNKEKDQLGFLILKFKRIMNYHPVRSENQANLLQVTQRTSHLSAVKRNFRQEITTGGCHFITRPHFCKKQTIVATSTTEAEYVAAASCCGQVLWIQNQMLDYGFNFMNTKIYIDNESTICIVKNPVYHSKTKHIAIRHHFIRDAYEKKLIQVLKIHTDDNVADLLTKAFDVSRCLKEFRELLSRDSNGTEALLLPTLFFLWLDKVSTASANLVPLGKVCTALEMLKKNTDEGTKCKLKRFP